MHGARWYDAETEDEAATLLVALADALAKDVGEPLRARYFAARSRYEGRDITSPTESTSSTWHDDRYNVSRSAVDTGQAEIASRQRPKPMFLTTGADWETKRRAKKADKFVEGQMHQRQGARYADVWELGEDVFKDAEIVPAGVIKVTVDYAQERVRYDRVPCYQVLVDPCEAEDGDPQQWFQVHELDIEQAVSMYGDGTKKGEKKLRELLEGSAKIMAHDRAARAVWKVKVREGWKLAQSDERMGKHVVACESGCILSEDFTWTIPPFALVVWSLDAFGIYGMSLVEQGAQQHDKIQEMATDLHARIRLCANRKTYTETGVVQSEALTSNEYEQVIEVTDISKIPKVEQVPPIGPAETAALQTEIDRYFEIGTGISQMHAGSRKEPGVDAAVAMQTLDDIQSVRFLPRARAYELLFVRLGQMTMLAARDLAEEHPNLMAKWPGKSFLETVEWKEASLDEDMYTVRVAPVSALSRDPAQRLQIVEQLNGMGMLPREKYAELIGMPDLESYFDGESSETRYVERLIDRYLDAKDDADLKKRGGYSDPEGYMLNPVAALVSVSQRYFDALANDVPHFNADLLRQYMRGLQKIIKAAAPPAPPGPPAAVVPGSAPVPGMEAAPQAPPPMGVAA